MPQTTRDADEAMRHHLTVVRGYLGLLLEDAGAVFDDEHWRWIERAYEASVDALRLHHDVRGETLGAVGPTA